MKRAKRTDWKTEPLPLKRAAVRLDKAFSQNEMDIIRRGLIPAQMEDKWFVFWEHDTLFFHRSWTGLCIYVAHFDCSGDSCRMVGAEVNREPAQYEGTSDQQDAEMISYLVDVLLLHRNTQFPNDELSPQNRALMNWSMVGRAMLGEHPNDD